ncbi:hypothetical protein GCM10017691_36230 [Pseudonocardia petroleophila]|uniref:Uncharacterized protein n=1 Tax=Pseudonocardia petroleophila TaxID=37331 RepID=A0A7G7MCV3_9PSEU|nr:hypothetical protein [Pseudonocardia petroleophila]QNG50614.1 hypothetical protein H6H00_20600 [Pseudonocardia petroleophila]
MTDGQTLAGAIAAALRHELTDLHPALVDGVARVAARISVQNLPLVLGSMPEDLMPQTRPDLSVVRETGVPETGPG